MNGESMQSINILIIVTTPSKGHYPFIRSLTIALGNRGHKITLISPERENVPLKNIKTIWMENIYDGMPGPANIENPKKDGTLVGIKKIYDFGVFICERAMKSQGVQELLVSKDPVDLIIMDIAGSQAFYGFVKHFGNPPVIGFSAFGNPPWISDVVGGGSEPWQVPHVAMTCSNRMKYIERFLNNFLYSFTCLYRRHFVIPRMKKIMQKYFFDPDDPADIERKFQLILVNADSIIDFPQSWPPTLIPVAGLHLVPADEDFTDLDLRLYMDNSTRGFVYVFLGETVDVDNMNRQKLNSLLLALSKLEENVIWHLPLGNLPETPHNIKIRRELDVNNVLGHPNVRMFFTSCGGLALQDAVYHGVPVLCLPFTANDFFNSRKSVTLKVGLLLDYARLTERDIFSSLRRILDDRNFVDRARFLSKKFRDQPTAPLERAVFWVEYVVRNSGTEHLRLPAVDMTWFQTSMTDVRLGYFFLTFLPLSLIFIFFVAETIGWPFAI